MELGFEVLGLGFKVLGLGSAVLGLGLEVLTLKPRSPAFRVPAVGSGVTGGGALCRPKRPPPLGFEVWDWVGLFKGRAVAILVTSF